MKCAVCDEMLWGAVVAVNNRICPLLGHWIHQGCQGQNRTSMIKMCFHCKRLAHSSVRSVFKDKKSFIRSLVEVALFSEDDEAFGPRSSPRHVVAARMARVDRMLKRVQEYHDKRLETIAHEYPYFSSTVLPVTKLNLSNIRPPCEGNDGISMQPSVDHFKEGRILANADASKPTITEPVDANSAAYEKITTECGILPSQPGLESTKPHVEVITPMLHCNEPLKDVLCPSETEVFKITTDSGTISSHGTIPERHSNEHCVQQVDVEPDIGEAKQPREAVFYEVEKETGNGENEAFVAQNSERQDSAVPGQLNNILERIRRQSYKFDTACPLLCQNECVHGTTDQLETYYNIKEELSSSCLAGFTSADFDTTSFDTKVGDSLPMEVKENFVPITTPQDGNCLYHAISQGLTKTSEIHRLLRRLQLSEMIGNKQAYLKLYSNMNMEDVYNKLLKQSSSYTAWGTSDSIQILSVVLSRRIFCYMNNNLLNWWELFDMCPELSSKIDPIFIVNSDLHFTTLVPISRIAYENLPNARSVLTQDGPIKMTCQPVQGDRTYEEVIVIEEDDTVGQDSTTNIQSGYLQRTTCGVFDKNIAINLNLNSMLINREEFSHDEVLFLNILRDEMAAAAAGPWEQNIKIFSKRTTHFSLWRKYVAKLFPRDPKAQQTKKFNAMRVFLNKNENYRLVQEAMREMGVPSVYSEDFTLPKRNEYIHSLRKRCIEDRDPEIIKKETGTELPEYLCERVPIVEETVQNEDDLLSVHEIGVEVGAASEASSDTIQDSIQLSTFERWIHELAKHMNISAEILQYKPPSNFEFTIPFEEAQLFYDFNSESFPSKSYAVILDKYLNKTQKCCAFKSTYKPTICKTTKPYAILHGACGCGLKFVVRVENKPVLGTPIVCLVDSIGEFNLIQEKPVGRPLKGHARAVAMQEVKHVKPGRVHLERLQSLDKYRALHNNFPQLSSSVLKLLKAQSKSDESAEADPFADIHAFNQKIIENEPQKKVKGFIHKFDQLYDNVKIVMYTEESLKLLHLLQKHEDVVLHIDATGSVVTQKHMSSKQCLLYLVMAKTKEHSFPVAEALSQRGTTLDICELLRRLRHQSKRLFPSMTRLSSIVVCDFSFAMLHGILEGLNSMSMEEYLQKSFELLESSRLQFHPEKAVVFICTSHLVHAFSRLLSRHVPKQLRYMGIASLAKLQETHDLQTYSNVVAIISKLFDTEYLPCKEVDKLKAKILDNFADLENVDIADPLADILDEFDTVFYANLRSKSPFYHLFRQIRTSEKTHSDSFSNPKNPYYMPSILKLLEDHYAPYTPLFSAMMLMKTGRYPDCRLSNACIEGEFSFIKNVFQTDGREGLNIFVRQNRIYHEGKVARVLEATMYAAKKKTNKKRKNAGRFTTKEEKSNQENVESPPPPANCKRQHRTTNICQGKKDSPLTPRKVCTSPFTARETWKKTPKKSRSPRYFSADKKLSSERFRKCEKRFKLDSKDCTTNLNASGRLHERKRHQGLANLGRSCYFNSLMQALFWIPDVPKLHLSESLANMYKLLSRPERPPTSSELLAVIDHMQKELGISIPTDKDEDVHELFMQLISNPESGLADQFHFLKEVSLSCACGASSFQFEDAYFITSNLSATTSIVEATCSVCNATSKTVTETNRSLPQSLCILEPIFSDGAVKKSTTTKLNEIKVCRELDSTSGSSKYDLVSLITHKGNSVYCGHYVAYTLLNSKWTKYDDGVVTDLEEEPDLSTEDLYLSFYTVSQDNRS